MVSFVLLKNFWKSFLKNSLQVLGLFLMLGAMITLFCGMQLSHDLTSTQLKIMGKDLFATNTSFEINDPLEIVNSDSNMSYSLTNINYINSDGKINVKKAHAANFKLTPVAGTKYYQVTFDSHLDNKDNWIGSKSQNQYFKDQLEKSNEVKLKFDPLFLANNPYFLSSQEFAELKNYLIEPDWTGLIPFVSSPDNNELKNDSYYQSKYKDFANNQARINQLEIKLLTSIIFGSVSQKALISQTMDIYDIFRTQYFYLQSVEEDFWTKPIMISGDYDNFINYQSENDILPVIINPTYASNHGYRIGSIINIYNYNFEIVGLATNAYVNSNYYAKPFTQNAYTWLRQEDFALIKNSITNENDQFITDDAYIFYGAVYPPEQELNPDFLKDQYSWYYLASLFNNAKINNWEVPWNPLDNIITFIKTKETMTWSLISAISILLIVSSFIMISMIINKLLVTNRTIIGNLKAQGYSATRITTNLVTCFFFLALIITSLSLLSSWLFSLVLNITYKNFLEFTAYLSVPTLWTILTIIVFPILAICLYAAIFILINIRVPALRLMTTNVKKPKLPKNVFWAHYFAKLSFQKKITLKFAATAKWKLLLTIITTSISGAMLFSAFTTVLNFGQVSYNLKNNLNWHYAYNYNNSYNANSPPYDFLVYDSLEQIKDPKVPGKTILDPTKEIYTKELVLEKVVTPQQTLCGPHIEGVSEITSLKYLWFYAKTYDWYANNCQNTPYYDEITNLINKSIYGYIIDQVSENNGIITIGYEPIIYGPEYQELFVNNSSMNGYEALNIGDLYSFLQSYQNANSTVGNDLSINNFYRNFTQNYNLKYFQGAGLEFYKYKDDNILFKPNLSTNLSPEWFFNGIDSFDEGNDSLLAYAKKNTFMPKVNNAILNVAAMKELIQSKNWFHESNPSWDPKNYSVDVYPIIINKGISFIHGINVGDIINKTFGPWGTTFYIVVDNFWNGPKNNLLVNWYTNTNLNQQHLSTLYSIGKTNSLYNYLGIYEKNNNYQIMENPNYEGAIVYQGAMDLDKTLSSTLNLQALLFIIYLLILFATILACIFQIFIITNIIIKDNLKVLNSFKALGYSDWWIFNRLFMIYLPIVIISWVIGIPIGIWGIDMVRFQIIWNMIAYVSNGVIWVDYLISFLGLWLMFIIAFLINKKFMNKRYPLTRVLN
ncbi:hypothetical protein SSYRP_v1c08630 [Spiroplasma syrphidicola EA-1]|uniref:ABC3 transporter permease C-terminal domain-containing protein n=1 Tax=Spiroplasma syrphidicola EA-1 TaxID=1276229 RepID=R4U4P6_9MOLU|nr:FtsX-like permease family protein [Spiroplasma syrphidicola]AGM26452.1 hypothetical protein SSYRP_v1c08630 [Spiroplasma syrphidicola EA-1]